MSDWIKNVEVGEAAVAPQLASTGVHSCLAVMIWPVDGTVFIHHIDSTSFDAEAEDVNLECLKIVQWAVEEYKECKGNVSFKGVFIIGGLISGNYGQLQQTFELLSTNPAALDSRATEPVGEVVRAFFQSLKYVNVCMNIDGEADGRDARADTFITDISIVCDGTTVPPMLCMAQYFGTEDELLGSEREVHPWLIFAYNFGANSWCVADIHPRDHRQSSFAAVVLAEFQKRNSSGNAGPIENPDAIMDILARVEI